MSVRDVALAACQLVVPSRWPEPAFQEMTGGKFDGGDPRSGSSCGFLASYVLMMIGCRDPRILNREVDGLAYTNGANISRIKNGAEAIGCWRTLDQGIPSPGDVVLCTNGPPSSEHVFVFDREVLDSEGMPWWESYDGGSPTRAESSHHAYDLNTARRLLSGGRLSFFGGPRRVDGYVDLDLVPLGAPPGIDDPGERDDGGPATLRSCLGLALVAAAGYYATRRGAGRGIRL